MSRFALAADGRPRRWRDRDDGVPQSAREPAMTTLQEVYCAATDCSPAEFRRRVFWRCLHPLTMMAVPLLGGMNAEYFSADRDLIADAGRVASMEQLRREIRDYLHDPRNQLWLRGRLRIRMSTSRLRTFAHEFLPDVVLSGDASARR